MNDPVRLASHVDFRKKAATHAEIVIAIVFARIGDVGVINSSRLSDIFMELNSKIEAWGLSEVGYVGYFSIPTDLRDVTALGKY